MKATVFYVKVYYGAISEIFVCIWLRGDSFGAWFYHFLLDDVDNTWDIQSSSGDVQITASKGSGSINTTSRDIDLDLGELTGDLRVNSSSGWAKIKVSADNSFYFEALISSGDINTFFNEDLSFSKRRNRATGIYGSDKDNRCIMITTTSRDVEIMD